MFGPSVPQTKMKIYRNGRWSARLRIKNKATGLPVDITNWVFRASLKKDPSSSTVTAAFEFATDDPTNGWVKMTIAAATRRAIPCGDYPEDPESAYHFDVLAASGSGQEYAVIAKGPAEIHHGVTSDV